MIMFALALQAATANVPNMGRRTQGIDFSQMPIEDAVSIMFEMISKDAHKDMRSMLSDMDQQRQKKAAMRDAQNEMAKEMQRLKALSRGAADSSNPVVQSQIEWANQLPSLCGNLIGEDREQCLENQVRIRTAQLRALPTPR